MGRSACRRQWRVLKLDRTEPSGLHVHEDPTAYTAAECGALLRTIADGNRSCGGLQLLAKAYGVVGTIRFLEGAYLILITRRRRLGTLCGHAVWGIGDAALVPIPRPDAAALLGAALGPESNTSRAEARYRRLFSVLDLTKDFFFSHTYNLAATLQVRIMDPILYQSLV